MKPLPTCLPSCLTAKCGEWSPIIVMIILFMCKEPSRIFKGLHIHIHP